MTSDVNSTTDSQQKKPITPAAMVGKLPIILDAMPKQAISVLWAGNRWDGTLEELNITDLPDDRSMSFEITMSGATNSGDAAETPKRNTLAPPCDWPPDGEFVMASEHLTPAICLLTELVGIDNLPTRRHAEQLAEGIRQRKVLGGFEGRKLSDDEARYYLLLLDNISNGVDALYLVLMSAFQLGVEWDEHGKKEANHV